MELCLKPFKLIRGNDVHNQYICLNRCIVLRPNKNFQKFYLGNIKFNQLLLTYPYSHGLITAHFLKKFITVKFFFLIKDSSAKQRYVCVSGGKRC